MHDAQKRLVAHDAKLRPGERDDRLVMEPEEATLESVPQTGRTEQLTVALDGFAIG
ncbi:MAG: hypothetical protein AW07_02224 [Candidatus Accumulibacter sp. SK-11]|nr:MAG: hypothetical protein AW07_02224 [Candidatus Accumulibacter sp. SK-11]